jgi:DNA-binding ferritin-like protein
MKANFMRRGPGCPSRPQWQDGFAESTARWSTKGPHFIVLHQHFESDETSRAAVGMAARASDADTSDLLNAVSRGVDKLLRMAEA